MGCKDARFNVCGKFSWPEVNPKAYVFRRSNGSYRYKRNVSQRRAQEETQRRRGEAPDYTLYSHCYAEAMKA